MHRIRHIADHIPFPAARTLWIAATGIVVAMLWGWLGMLFLNLGLLLLCLLDFFFLWREETIECFRSCPRHLLQGVSQEIEIVLRNPGDRVRVLYVRDQTPLQWDAGPVLRTALSPRSALSLRYAVVPENRGSYRFGNLHMRVAGPLGLVFRSLVVKADEEVKVFPRLQPLRYPDLATYRRMTQHWGLRRTRRRGEGREFDALRDYIEGDDPRKIHWKASARMDRPIVQEYQPERNQIVMTLLDAGRLMGAVSEGKTKLDYALDATVQLTHTVLSGGDQAGFLAFADRVVSFVPPKGRPGQLQSILEATLMLEPLLVEPRYEEAFLWLRAKVRRRSLVVIFTDLLDEATSENLLGAVALLRPRHLPLCVTIRDSEWESVIRRYPEDVQGVYEQAVLQESLRQRESAMRHLVRKGALVLDLPPGRLSMGIMERYLEVKGRGLL